ncbi:hypothetical protein KAU08_03405 [bacterium]|nr:hypothetical protein [bacterium]
MKINTSINLAVRIIAVMALGLAYFSVYISPMQAQGFSVSFGRQEFVVEVGGTINGSVLVQNMHDEPLSVRVYLGEWLRNQEGASKYTLTEEIGLESRSLAAWMLYMPDQMTVESQGERSVLFEVRMPEDEILEGSYWGIIYVESIPDAESFDEIPVEGERRIGVRTIFRYAVQIYVTIEGTEIREASFTALNIEPAEGGFNVIAIFENTGNIHLRPEVWLEMTDIAGDVVYEQEHGKITVLPESAREFVFELRDLPIESGEYMVMIYADYGVPTLIAAQGRVNLTITPPEPEEEEPADPEEPAEAEDDTPSP